MKLTSIRGVIPAMLTCFDEKGNYDEKKQRDLTEFLIGKGIDGLYLTGSTGEAFLMDGDERRAVVETVIDQAKGRVPIIVHVGDIGTRKSIALAHHAYEAGADAISSVPPFYFRFSAQEILHYYEELSDATPLPLIVYNIALAGMVSHDLILKIARFPHIQGIKYTAQSHQEIFQLKQELGKHFMIYSGCDEMALSGFIYGADGIIGSFYNVIPEIFMQLRDAFDRGDLKQAQKCQQLADALVLLILQYPYFSAMKRITHWMGHSAGEVREPFATLTGEQEKSLIAGLRNIRAQYGTSNIEALEKLPD